MTHVHTRAVRKPGIAQWRGFIHTPTDAGYDLIDDLHQVLVVFEDDIRKLQHTAPLHVDPLMGVDEDVAHRRDRLAGARAVPKPKTSSRTSCAIRSRSGLLSGTPLLRHQLLNQGEQLLLLTAILRHVAQLLQVETLDQLLVDGRLELLLHMFGDAACGAKAGQIQFCRCSDVALFSSCLPGSRLLATPTSTSRTS